MKDCPLHAAVERRIENVERDLRLEGDTRREEVHELWQELRSLGERLAAVRPMVHLLTSLLSGGIVAVVSVVLARAVGD